MKINMNEIKLYRHADIGPGVIDGLSCMVIKKTGELATWSKEYVEFYARWQRAAFEKKKIKGPIPSNVETGYIFIKQTDYKRDNMLMYKK